MDLQIDEFYKDAASGLLLLYQAFPRKVALYVDDLIGRDEGWDVICAGDVCYEREMAERVIAWLSGLSARGATVLIGAPGRSYLPRERLEALATYEVPVTRALEDAEIKRSSVWRLAR